jgi:polar amino acid transport system permease protein
MTVVLLPAAISIDFTHILEDLPLFLGGIVVSIALAIATMVISVPAGLAVAVARLSGRRPLGAPAYAFTELFRTTPLLVWVYILFFAVPIEFGLNLPVFWIGVLALSLNVTAFLAEVFRGAIRSLDPGQREAALATGMTERTALRRIILPQAILRAVPMVAATWISLFRDTSVVAIIGVRELTDMARFVSTDTYRPIEAFTVASVLYIALTYPQALLVNRLFERFRVRE